ncbi:MAG: hypothetical protein GF313_11390 [Caldithrix sp.]|nr:hypothetical protein [Caldithrix sp.]
MRGRGKAQSKTMAEYDGNQDLTLWRLGGFGYRTPDGDSHYYLKDHPAVAGQAMGNISVTVNTLARLRPH